MRILTAAFMSNGIDKLLGDGMRAMAIETRVDTITKLHQFMDLLEQWNSVYNLTGARDSDSIARLHLLDSLAAAPHLRGDRIIDVGTGAGLPGIPLALVSPEKQFQLLDSNAKKTRFVQQAIIQLKLDNVAVAQQRVEQFSAAVKFDTLITRAFGSLNEIVSKGRHLLRAGGQVLALKGKFPKDEIAELPESKCSVTALEIPGVSAERYLVSLSI